MCVITGPSSRKPWLWFYGNTPPSVTTSLCKCAECFEVLCKTWQTWLSVNIWRKCRDSSLQLCEACPDWIYFPFPISSTQHLKLSRKTTTTTTTATRQQQQELKKIILSTFQNKFCFSQVHCGYLCQNNVHLRCIQCLWLLSCTPTEL